MVIRHCREVDRDRTQKLIWHVIIMFFMSDRWSFEVEFLSHIERENLAARIKQSFNLNFVVCRYDASIAAWFSACMLQFASYINRGFEVWYNYENVST